MTVEIRDPTTATISPTPAALEPEEAAWHLSPRSGGCPFYLHCRAEADRTDDLARVPGITALAKSVLHGRGIRTVAQLNQRGIKAGTYVGSVSLWLKDLTIIGAGDERTILQGDGSFGSAVSVTSAASLTLAFTSSRFLSITPSSVPRRMATLTTGAGSGHERSITPTSQSRIAVGSSIMAGES